MRNNPYKNLIKVLTPKKTDRLIIQRKGDEYFITETHMIFRISSAVYETYLHNEKPLVFPILESESCISNGKPCNMNCNELFYQHKPDSRYAAFTTDILKEIKGDLARLYLIEDKSGVFVPMLINERFHKAIEPFDCRLACGGSNKYPLCLYDGCDELFGIVCPINYGNEDLKKHGKALAALANIDIWTAKNKVA